MATRILALTFARGTQAWTPQVETTDTGNGTLSEVGPYDDSGSTKHLSWAGPLPDLILAPLSTVAFMVGYTGGPNAAIAVTPTVVTLTQEQVASTVQVPAGPFMLVPGPES